MIRLATLFVTIFLSFSAQAGSAYVAVASNFTTAAKEIAKMFEKETGHQVILSFGSTGKLYSQILHGAPFEVFLAADQERPEKLENEGNALAGSRFTYDVGKIALYPAKDQQILVQKSVHKIAIANPKTAPYGIAALQILEKLDLKKNVSSKLVRGENIAQTYQFVATGNAQVGFVALSQVLDKEKWIVPQDYYDPIKQDAVLLPKAQAVAHEFMGFLKSDVAQTIINRYGY